MLSGYHINNNKQNRHHYATHWTRCLFRYSICIILIGVFCLCGINYTASGAGEIIFLVPVEGMITTGTAGFIQRQIQEAQDTGAEAVIILMNTPGGLMDATLEIHRMIRASRIPVIVLVAPSGSIAASAGAFILLSADVAAMAPGTTVGAAHPIALAPGGDAAPADEKTVNFLAGHIRSIARESNRPEDIAEKFVTENLVLNYDEALEEGVIDFISISVDKLLNELDGLEVKKHGQNITLNTAGASLVDRDMNVREKFHDWVSNPQISFLLMMLGVMGIYFGLSMPGTFVPETIGVVALIMGIYGLGLFDTNTTGVILIILGVGLLVAEVLTAGFGIFGIAGAASLIVGAMLLPMEPLMAPDWYQAFRVTALGITITIVLLLAIVVQRVMATRRMRREGKSYFDTPEKAVVVEDLVPTGLVSARGEIWKARHTEEGMVKVGEEVKVTGQDGLTLMVKVNNKEKTEN